MDWLKTLTDAGLPAARAWVENGHVQAEFTRELTPAEWQTFLALTNPAEARRHGARGEAALATELRTLTPDEAVAYIETKVTNLAEAKKVLKIMARMLIAMRDQVWPDLPDD